VLLKFLCVLALSANAFAAGKITFLKGKVTALTLKQGVHHSKPLSKNDTILPGHSYLTHDLSQAVIKMDDGTWLRLGSDTKFEVSENKEHFVVTILTGTARVLFAPALQKKSKLKRLVLQTPDAHIETAEGKFTLTYMPLFQHTSVYVEKGLVQLSSMSDRILQVPETIHAGEYSELVKNEAQPRTSRQMSEREQNMLKTLMFSQLKESKNSF
jgi:ferric-dicitrate binding protein FerR (iron transport regulator)